MYIYKYFCFCHFCFYFFKKIFVVNISFNRNFNQHSCVLFILYNLCIYILLLYSSYIFFSMPPAKKAKFPCGIYKKECNAMSVGWVRYMVSLFLWETWPLLNDYVNIFHFNSQKPFEGTTLALFTALTWREGSSIIYNFIANNGCLTWTTIYFRL